MVATVVFLFTACDVDDNTGFSGMVPTNPTISVDVPAGGVNLLEAKTTYLFDVTISETQVVDLSIYISVIAGTATLGEDFTIDNGNSRVYIPAGKTTGQVSITVLEDELLEETETFTIQIGDERTANAVLTPVTVDFTLTNLTGDDLAIGLSWETDVAEAIGLELDADEVVDMRLLIVDMDGNVIESADGSSFEEFVLTAADWADGEYIIAADIFATIDVGDYNSPVTLDLALQFDQVGLINGKSFAYPAVMTNELNCDAYRTNLAIVTKSGSTYTIEESISYFAKDNSPLVGTWSGIDTESDYPSEVVTTIDGNTLKIDGLNFGWMLDFWEETVLSSTPAEVQVNWCAGTITIVEQDYMVTIYNGDEYPYTIKGSGTFDASGVNPTMVVNYEVFQDGFSPSQWAFDNGFESATKFKATLTLDAAVMTSVPTQIKSKPIFTKPIR